MSSVWFHSRRKLYFKVVLVLFVITILGYIALKVGWFFLQQRIVDENTTLSGQNAIVASYTSLTGYNKLQAVKHLETQKADVPWADHINKVIAMLGSLRNIQSTATDMIQLSDFTVNLDEISLKGKVSDLSLVYADDPVTHASSLWDKFASLDFVKNISIQSYDTVWDNNYFEFVLHANVINDGTK